MELCIRCLQTCLNALLICSLLMSSTVNSSTSQSDIPHSRQKRLLWVTDDGRLALPPGTSLVITPSLSLPFVRYPPDGFFSNMSISLPFTIDFNKLGLTDNQNPYGVVPPLLARSMGRAAGNLLGSYIHDLINKRRKRDITPVEVPVEHRDAFHGGERVLLYMLVEDFLTNFGMNGKACLLRAICEVHAHPLHNFGLIGEMLKLFFTASKSPYSDYLDEYVKAERDGGGFGNKAPGECWAYLKQCPKSLFRNADNLYSKETNEAFQENEVNLNSIENSSNHDHNTRITSNLMLKPQKPANM